MESLQSFKKTKIYSENLASELTIYSHVPYFFGYKTEIFSFQNNSKDLDLSYKTDLDLWDCLGRVKLIL